MKLTSGLPCFPSIFIPEENRLTMSAKPEKYTEAYVWIWLLSEVAPVVAGKL